MPTSNVREQTRRITVTENAAPTGAATPVWGAPMRWATGMGNNLTVTLTKQLPTTSLPAVVVPTLTDFNNGSYLAAYTLTLGSVYSVFVSFAGAPVPGSPFDAAIPLDAGPLSPYSTLTGDGATSGATVKGSATTFIVQAVDAYRNPIATVPDLALITIAILASSTLGALCLVHCFSNLRIS